MADRSRGRVLCVDDNPDIAHSTSELLGLVGLDARSCLSGLEALAVAAAFRPHACVLDINMPGLDGYELAGRLRALLGPVFLIAVTAASGGEHERRLAAAGFALQLVKPADPVHLLAVLGRETARVCGEARGADAGTPRRRGIAVGKPGWASAAA